MTEASSSQSSPPSGESSKGSHDLPSSAGSDNSPAALEAEDRQLAQDARRMKRGAGHTYLTLLAASVLLMAVSPFLNRFLDAWQGVVVSSIGTDELEILKEDGMIIELSLGSEAERAGFPVGSYLSKTSLEWTPVAIPHEALVERETISDPSLQAKTFLPSRAKLYLSAWSGVVVEIINQQLPTRGNGMGEVGMKSSLVLQSESGERFERPLSESLQGRVAVGVRLEKRARQWEPEVIGPAQGPSQAP